MKFVFFLFILFSLKFVVMAIRSRPDCWSIISIFWKKVWRMVGIKKSWEMLSIETSRIWSVSDYDSQQLRVEPRLRFCWQMIRWLMELQKADISYCGQTWANNMPTLTQTFCGTFYSNYLYKCYSTKLHRGNYSVDLSTNRLKISSSHTVFFNCINLGC